MVEAIQQTAVLVALIGVIIVWAFPEDTFNTFAKVIILGGVFGGVATAVVTAFIRIWQ